MKECKYMKRCGFYIKYHNKGNANYLGYIEIYCHGEKMLECSRIEYMQRFHSAPPDELTPSGNITEDEMSQITFNTSFESYY